MNFWCVIFCLLIVDSQSQDLVIGGAVSVDKSSRRSSYRAKADGNSNGDGTTTTPTSGEGVIAFDTTGSYKSTAGITSPSNTATSTAAVNAAASGGAAASAIASSAGSINTDGAKLKAVAFSQLRGTTEDSYNDFNYWKIPPAIIDDDFY